MQALYLLALQPVAETKADHNSYGFRPEKACRDAAAQCFAALVSKNSAQWVLDADISGCFDNISHDWLLANIPMDKTVLKKWLKSGFVEKRNLVSNASRHSARRYFHAIDTKDNFEFERQIEFSRSSSLLDRGRKR